MNKKYIDFVPKNAGSARAKKSPQVIMPSQPTEKKPVAGGASEEKVVKNVDDAKSVKSAKSKKIAMKPSALMGDGMIRSAMKRTFRSKKAAKVAKSASIEAPAQKDEILEQTAARAGTANQMYRVSQTRFVNTDKVVKRPLSKNVYQKKVVEPKEVPQGPVTIIQKPEKDSKVGLVVTIIITIILGAAAGTVAFLLLPK
ncbi:hypothetical protein IKT18_01740 [Candidatus Saccharibacteria bacterium]|nr:hypothetical protein [Candidatus Saccharibacteria bacterium]